MMFNSKQRWQSGISMVEILVGSAIFLVVGAVLYPVFRSTLILTTQNVAINTTHVQSRAALARVTQSIRESSSPPRLVDANLNPVTTGPAAGIEFYNLLSGPAVVWNPINPASKNIWITKRPGDRTLIDQPPGLELAIPSLGLQQAIASVNGEGVGQPLHNVELAANPSMTSGTSLVQITAGDPIYPAFVMQRSAYVVVGGVLRLYPRSDLHASGGFVEVARDVTSPRPFTISSDGTSTVSADFTFTDSRSNQRDKRMTTIRSTFMTTPRSPTIARFK